MTLTKTLSLTALISLLLVSSAYSNSFLNDARMLATISPSTVSSTSSSKQTAPVLITLTGGSVVAAWLENLIIKVRIFDNYGTFKFDGASINPTGFTLKGFSLAPLTSGGYVVVYQATASSSTQVSYQLFTASGTSSGSAVQIFTGANAAIAPDNMKVKVAGLSNGGFAITCFVSDPITTPPTAKNVYVAVYSSTGTNVLPITAVNTDAISGSDSYPAIASLYDGGFVVAFSNLVSGNTYNRIYLKIYSNTGTVTKAAFENYQSGNGDNFTPSLAGNQGKSGFVVAYQNSYSGYNQVYSTSYTSSGALAATTSFRSLDMSASQPTVFTTTSGLTMFAWIHSPYSGNNYQVYVASKDYMDNYLYTESSINTANYLEDEKNVVVATPTNNGFFVAWPGLVSASVYNIYGYGFSNKGDQTAFQGSCFITSECSASTNSCLYPSRTCSACVLDGDCGNGYLCYQNLCQSNAAVAAKLFGGLASASIALLWWVILLIVLGGVCCLVIVGCIIWRLCRRSPTRTIVVKQQATPQPVAVQFGVPPPQQVQFGGPQQNYGPQQGYGSPQGPRAY